MSYEDRPTIRQIGAYLNLVKWKVTNAEEEAMRLYLEANCNRKQMSEELNRVRNLFIDRQLEHDKVFESQIWDGFKAKKEGA